MVGVVAQEPLCGGVGKYKSLSIKKNSASIDRLISKEALAPPKKLRAKSPLHRLKKPTPRLSKALALKKLKAKAPQALVVGV